MNMPPHPVAHLQPETCDPPADDTLASTYIPYDNHSPSVPLTAFPLGTPTASSNVECFHTFAPLDGLDTGLAISVPPIPFSYLPYQHPYNPQHPYPASYPAISATGSLFHDRTTYPATSPTFVSPTTSISPTTFSSSISLTASTSPTATSPTTTISPTTISHTTISPTTFNYGPATYPAVFVNEIYNPTVTNGSHDGRDNSSNLAPFRANASGAVRRHSRARTSDGPSSPHKKHKGRTRTKKSNKTSIKRTAPREEDDLSDDEADPIAEPNVGVCDSDSDSIQSDDRTWRINSERGRRDDLRDCFDILKEVLPISPQKTSMVSLVNRAISRIAELEESQRILLARLGMDVSVSESESPPELTRRDGITNEQFRRQELRHGFIKLKQVLPLSPQKSSMVNLVERATAYITQLDKNYNIYLAYLGID